MFCFPLPSKGQATGTGCPGKQWLPQPWKGSRAWSSLVSWEVSLPMARPWSWMVFKTNHLRILWICGKPFQSLAPCKVRAPLPQFQPITSAGLYSIALPQMGFWRGEGSQADLQHSSSSSSLQQHQHPRAGAAPSQPALTLTPS